MSGSSSSSSSGIGLFGATFLVLLALKLTGHIDWSWWWITAPLWGGIALVLLVVGALIAFASRPLPSSFRRTRRFP